MIVIIAIIVAIVAAFFVFNHHGESPSSGTADSTTSFAIPSNKAVILYVNQGNALVDQGNFSNLLSFAKSHQFNTIFFQIYRGGQLLFNTANLTDFVGRAHIANLSIYFSLYFTAPGQLIPASIYGLGENGINLDMSTLPISTQNNILTTLSENYHGGKTAVTTTNFTTALKPDLLILETYDFQVDQQYVHSGTIAAIEPAAISSPQQYQQEFEYALNNSDGVMVFDYYGLLQSGY